MIWACANGHPAVVELLVTRGANIEAKNSGGATGLWLAVANEHAKVVEVLIVKGANVAVADNDGTSAMDLAYEKKNAVIASMLKDPVRGCLSSYTPASPPNPHACLLFGDGLLL